MASFGDNSTVYQRAATIPGGLRIEGGCWTAGSDTSVHIPTQFTEVVCLVCGSEGLNEAPDITDGGNGRNIVATTGGTTSGKIVNYIALGY